MRIEHIRVDGFGRLAGFDTGPKSLGRLVVVLGPNEAGKSTLFSFLTTALYGFSPASRDLSPYVPWGADEAGGEIRLALRDGSCAVVSRRLRSSPAGTLTIGEATQELRNRPIRWVEHVPRTVFRQVFAITLAELAGLDETTWGSIQDRVLGSMGASDLRSARAVADELEREAGEIWRPNRRGNQELRDLQREIRELRARRNDAVERDRRIRELVEERENVHLRLVDAREDRNRDKAAIERMQELIPVKRQLDRIAELRRDGGPREELRGLPASLEEHRERLTAKRDRLAREVEELDAELDAPRSAVERFDEPSREILRHRAAVTAFLTRVDGSAEDRRGLAALDAKLQDIDARLEGASGHLVGDADDVEDELRAIEALSVDLLRDRIQRLEAADTEEADAARAPGTDQEGTDGIVPALALVALGAALLAWGLSGGPMPATAAGAACLAVGLTLASVRRRPTPAPSGADRSTGPAQETRLRSEIESMLDGISVGTRFLDPPGPALVSEIARLQGLMADGREARRQRELHRRRLDELRGEAKSLVERLGPAGAAVSDVPPAADGASDPDAALPAGTTLAEDPLRIAALLRDGLDAAERRRDEAAAAEREIERLERSRAVLVAELEDATAEAEDLDRRIAALGTGAPERAVHAAEARLEAHARADRLQEELERAHPDLPHLQARIRDADEDGASWTVDEDDLARRKLRVAELDETIEELAARAEALERDALHLREQETVDAVDSAVESLREDETRLKRERDRKWLLARLIREADRRFREEHQPDLLRRASEYLQRLTGGRYDRLMVDEDGDGDLFQLMGPQLPAPVPLARPISTGTLEQAYLGLRLAIVDHLDQSEERLPLFMDEAFVNWDDQRREKGLEVLGEVSRSRQVFAFTCHPEMAEDLARRGACVLPLTR